MIQKRPVHQVGRNNIVRHGEAEVVVTYAVDSPRWQTSVALAADHLVAVVLGGKGLERGLDDATTETEDQVESRLLLDVVVGQGAAILELLAGEDETLLVRRNALLVLDLALHIVDGVGGLNLEGDGLASHYESCQYVDAVVLECSRLQQVAVSGVSLTSLDEDLHGCGVVCVLY